MLTITHQKKIAQSLIEVFLLKNKYTCLTIKKTTDYGKICSFVINLRDQYGG